MNQTQSKIHCIANKIGNPQEIYSTILNFNGTHMLDEKWRII